MTEEQTKAYVEALSRKRYAEHDFGSAQQQVDVLTRQLADAKRRQREAQDELAEANRVYALTPKAG